MTEMYVSLSKTFSTFNNKVSLFLVGWWTNIYLTQASLVL